jgi:hypothetical protein
MAWRPCVAARLFCWPLVIACLALAGCGPDGKPNLTAAQPRGASIAFETIDGPPPAQFQKLVKELNDEAQSRRLAVISRERDAVYRVRGYLAAKVVSKRKGKPQTTVTWVWDVFDRNERRALRISGEETSEGRRRDAWSAADDAMLKRIAKRSVDELAAFLNTPAVIPTAQAAEPQAQIALAGQRD